MSTREQVKGGVRRMTSRARTDCGAGYIRSSGSSLSYSCGIVWHEPSLGLAPNFVATVFKRIADISRETGMAILIVEQKVREVLDICNRVYSMKLGRIAFAGQPDDLKENKARLKELFL